MSEQDLIPGISVVLCCCNSSEVLPPTLIALQSQRTVPGVPAELILVDNNCTDDTVALAQRLWQSTSIPLRVVPESTPGILHARRRGVFAASYDLTLFVDDDNILEPNWFERIVQIFQEKPDVGALGGINEAYVSTGIPDWFERWQGVYACGAQGKQSGDVSYSRKMLFGAGLSMRTALIRSVLASEPPLVLVGRTGSKLLRGDDSEICMRCVLDGWRLWFDDSLRLKHNLLPRRVTWDYVLQARRNGAAAQVILNIYSALIEHRRPPTFKRSLWSLIKAWSKFLPQLLRFSTLRRPGSERAIERQVLLGKTDALISLGREYSRIRRALINRYRKRKAP